MAHANAWTFETAREMLREVRAHTARAVGEVEALLEEAEGFAKESPEREAAERRVSSHMSLWARQMEALGVVVKGPWLVDFDSGSGYFCWCWPEDELLYFHGYDDGFEGRTRIQ